jgi:hypothetical protein
LIELQALRQDVRALAAAVNKLRPEKRKGLSEDSSFVAKAQKLARRFPESDCQSETDPRVVTVKAKTHKGKPRDVGAVFVAPLIKVVGDALVLHRVLRCTIKSETKSPAQKSPAQEEKLVFLTVPKDHGIWALIGSTWLKATYRWPSDLVALAESRLDASSCELVAEYEGDAFERSATAASLNVRETLLVASGSSPPDWHAVCPLLLDPNAPGREHEFAAHLADFVCRKSPLVPAILDAATGTTRQLALCHVEFRRPPLVAWDSSFYLATVTRLGYVQTDSMQTDDVRSPWTVFVVPGSLDRECVVQREAGSCETVGAVLYVDLVDRESTLRDKSKCGMCGVVHQAMCVSKFSVPWGDQRVDFLPRKTTRPLTRRPHIVVSQLGSLGWRASRIQFA